MKQTISVLVENQAGVLNRITGLFSRRAFNIESLAVGVTDDPTISRITIIVDSGNSVVEQVEKQLNKVIQVIKVRVLQPGSFYSCYLSLIKVSSNAQQRADIMKIAELMNAQIVDVATDCLTMQFTDSVERTETLISLLKPYGIKEIVRAGALAIEKGSAVARRKGN